MINVELIKNMENETSTMTVKEEKESWKRLTCQVLEKRESSSKCKVGTFLYCFVPNCFVKTRREVIDRADVVNAIVDGYVVTYENDAFVMRSSVIEAPNDFKIKIFNSQNSQTNEYSFGELFK